MNTLFKYPKPFFLTFPRGNFKDRADAQGGFLRITPPPMAVFIHKIMWEDFLETFL